MAKKTEKNGNITEGNGSHDSDTQKIIHRHLNNQKDIITDEDIRNVRIGVTPVQLDEATRSRFEEEGLTDNNETETGSTRHITPWDIANQE